jgi:membrane protease YdiL (CAAX protease family)
VGWLLSQFVAAVAFVVVAPRFLVSGTASGVAAAEVLDDAAISLAAGAPLLALALWQVPVWATQLATVAIGTTARHRSWRHDLGLQFRPSDVVVGLVSGVGAQLVIGILYQLAGIDSDGPARQLTSKGSGIVGLIGMLLLLAVAAPVVEEVMFRGLLQRGLATQIPDLAALAITTTLFAAVHFQPVQFPGLLIAGLVFGGLALRKGRLGPAIMAHVFFNASTVLLLAAA